MQTPETETEKRIAAERAELRRKVDIETARAALAHQHFQEAAEGGKPISVEQSEALAEKEIAGVLPPAEAEDAPAPFTIVPAAEPEHHTAD